jgi:hypothetical protein
MEGKIRTERKETLYKQREKRKKFLEWIAIIGAFIVAILVITGILWLIVNG